jgi:gliding motility-associated-like protein
MKKYTSYFVFFFNIFCLQAQPYTTQCIDNATQLVNILVNGVPFSNATLSGFDCSTGSFESPNPADGLNIENGLMMATNAVDASGAPFGSSSVEADLTEQLQIVGSSSTDVNNVIVLEFDFEPNSDQIAFEYVFASEEYNLYTCDQFNDVFGFFLSGPGIDGPFTNNAVNIALVPDPDNPGSYTDTPVLINSINSGVASGGTGNNFYCDDIDPNWQEYSVFFSENSGTADVAYNGFTVPLIATYSVIPCETYHIKLAIADVFDGALNSAVFLTENSFSSVGLSIEADSDYGAFSGDDTTIVEGCFDGALEFELSQQIETDYIIDFSVSGTALDGIDYQEIGNQVTISAGDLEAEVPIVPYYDGVVEGLETLIITATTSDGCSEVESDYTFNIVDRVELFLEMPDDIAFCPGSESIELDPLITGGIYPLTYQWTFNDALFSNQDEITILPDNIGVFSFTAQDLCSSLVFGETETYLLEPEEPLAIFSSYDQIQVCTEDELSTEILLNGGIGDYEINWYQDGEALGIDSINFEISTDIASEYILELEVEDDCSNTISQQLSIQILDCFVPNIFTPNSDGKNDYWFVEFGDVVNNVRVDIFNRWGQLVFNSINYEKCNPETGQFCWTGIHMSEREDCEDGIYYYNIEMTDGRAFKGTFSLFR